MFDNHPLPLCFKPLPVQEEFNQRIQTFLDELHVLLTNGIDLNINKFQFVV